MDVFEVLRADKIHLLNIKKESVQTTNIRYFAIPFLQVNKRRDDARQAAQSRFPFLLIEFLAHGLQHAT